MRKLQTATLLALTVAAAACGGSKTGPSTELDDATAQCDRGGDDQRGLPDDEFVLGVRPQ